MEKRSIFFALLLLVGSLSACNQKTAEHTGKNVNPSITESELQEKGFKTAYFASGCFWCVEAIFQSVMGVEDAISGYSGGDIKNPTYEQVSRAETKHAEAVKVIYDPSLVDFETLVKVFFGSHDPTTLNRQGPDRGPQYRSVAFYENEEERMIIEDYIKALQEANTFSAPIVTEVKAFKTFWDAEEYHQEFENLHPNHPYIQSVSIPRLKAFQEKYPDLLKASH